MQENTFWEQPEEVKLVEEEKVNTETKIILVDD